MVKALLSISVMWLLSVFLLSSQAISEESGEQIIADCGCVDCPAGYYDPATGSLMFIDSDNQITGLMLPGNGITPRVVQIYINSAGRASTLTSAVPISNLLKVATMLSNFDKYFKLNIQTVAETVLRVGSSTDLNVIHIASIRDEAKNMRRFSFEFSLVQSSISFSCKELSNQIPSIEATEVLDVYEADTFKNIVSAEEKIAAKDELIAARMETLSKLEILSGIGNLNTIKTDLSKRLSVNDELIADISKQELLVQDKNAEIADLNSEKSLEQDFLNRVETVSGNYKEGASTSLGNLESCKAERNEKAQILQRVLRRVSKIAKRMWNRKMSVNRAKRAIGRLVKSL